MQNTPKNFALQVGALITLFINIGALLALIFGLINLKYPDAAEGYYGYEAAQSGIRYAIAVLIVFFPAFLWLTRTVNQARRQETNFYHTLTKWIMYLAMMIGGLVLLGDLVALILTFLNGEITTRFILKALSILVVVGGALYYYWYDTKDYWTTHERESVRIGAVVSVVVIAAVIYGYTLIDSPQKVRAVRLDQQQLYDLQDMQWRIEAHFASEGALPITLKEVYVDMPAPTAPEDRPAYRYEATGERTYELCATFAEATPESERMMSKPYIEPGMNPNNFNWEHAAGEKCFERTVTEAAAPAAEKEQAIDR